MCVCVWDFRGLRSLGVSMASSAILTTFLPSPLSGAPTREVRMVGVWEGIGFPGHRISGGGW